MDANQFAGKVMAITHSAGFDPDDLYKGLGAALGKIMIADGIDLNNAARQGQAFKLVLEGAQEKLRERAKFEESRKDTLAQARARQNPDKRG
jgi:hypothetical protein